MKERRQTHTIATTVLVALLALPSAYGQTNARGAVGSSDPDVLHRVSSAYGTASDFARTGRGALALQPHPPLQPSPLSTALIVLGREASQADLDSLTEDLNIMCRILDRTLAGAGLRSDRREVFAQLLLGQSARNWGDRLFGDFSSWTECLYIEGHGPLFLLSVDFPLVEPPQAPRTTDPNGPSDPVWAEVSQGLYATPGRRPPQTGAAEPPYNPVKVLSLKKAVIRSLKHAANIRGLAPEATVTVLIKGGQTTKSAHGAMVSSNMGYDDPIAMLHSAAGQTTRMSQLVIRAAVEDIKAFSAGALSDAEFTKRIQTVQY